MTKICRREYQREESCSERERELERSEERVFEFRLSTDLHMHKIKLPEAGEKNHQKVAG